MLTSEVEVLDTTAAADLVKNMRVVCVLLGVLVVGAWAMVLPKISEPPCDSLEAETAAAVFQDYINSQRTSGFKYALNQIDEIKIRALVSGKQKTEWSKDQHIH